MVSRELTSQGAVPVVVSTFGVLLWLVQSGRTSLAGAGAAAVAIRLLSGRIDQVTKGIASLYESSLFLADLEAFVARGAAALAGASSARACAVDRPPYSSTPSPRAS